MKKNYLLVYLFSIGVMASAQTPYETMEKSKIQKGVFGVEKKKKTNLYTQKAEGDIEWSNDFEDPSDWLHVDGGSHTDGDWQIVSEMPQSLVTESNNGYNFATEMNSPTGDVNGGSFALIDSDEAGTNGVQDAYFEYQSAIDFSALGDTALTIKFHQIYRRYNETYTLEISNDGGTNWEEFNVNPDVPTNTNSDGTEIKEINITSVIGTGNWSNDVRIRFHYEGAYDWFWGVDDIEIYQSWENDLKLRSTVAIGGTQELDYHFIPSSQTSFDGFGFESRISNEGSQDQTEAALNVTIPGTSYDEFGGVINTGSNVLASQDLDTFEITNKFDIVSEGEGTYEIKYEADLGLNTDANMVDNRDSSEVTFGGFEYGRDDGSTTAGLIAQIGSQTDAALKIGNVMEIFDDMSVAFINIFIPSLTQAAIDARVGSQISAEIHLWDNNNGEFNYIAGTALHTVKESDFGTWVKIPMENLDPYELLSGDLVLVTANHFGGADEMTFQLAQNVEEGTVSGFNAAGDPFTLTDPGAVAIRLNEDVESLNVSDVNSFDTKVNLYPNPATNQANASFKLENSSEVTYKLTDMSGKVIYENTMEGLSAGKHNVSIPTETISNGVYFFSLKAGENSTTKKLVVNK
ncbi:MAG: T9SS type A sorting domain-containing protein [Brumimicrobium sp.]